MATKLLTLLVRPGRRLAVLVLALATAFTSLVAFSPAAHAALSNCGTSPQRVCVWVDANYNGLQADYYNVVVGNCYSLGSAMNDKVSSIANHTPYFVRFYPDANCSTPHIFVWIDVSSGSTNANLAGTGLNDELSSFRVFAW